MYQTKVVWRANPDISFPYAQLADDADTIKANEQAIAPSAQEQSSAAAQDQSLAIQKDQSLAIQKDQSLAAQANAQLLEQAKAAEAQSQENMARNAAIVSETFAALKSSLLSEQSLSDRTHWQLESEITDNERLANDARAEQFATEQQLAAYAQEQAAKAQEQARAAHSLGSQVQVAPPLNAPVQAFSTQTPNQAYTPNQAQDQMAYAPNQAWQSATPAMHSSAMQAAASALAMPAAASAPAMPAAVQSAPAMAAPSRPDADVYVQPDSSIEYLENMMRFLNSKGLRVATYHPAWQYLPNDIILMPYAPYPMPSSRTFVMTNDKKAVWNFLKSEFASRGIAL